MEKFKVHIRNPHPEPYVNKPLCAPKAQKRMFIFDKDPEFRNDPISCLSCLKKSSSLP